MHLPLNLLQPNFCAKNVVAKNFLTDFSSTVSSYVGRCLSCCVQVTLSAGRIYIEQLLIMLQCKNRSDWKHRREVVNCSSLPTKPPAYAEAGFRLKINLYWSELTSGFLAVRLVRTILPLWFVRVLTALHAVAIVEQLVTDAVNGNPVVVFSKSYCPFCKMAKDVLRQAGLRKRDYVIYELDERGEKRLDVLVL